MTTGASLLSRYAALKNGLLRRLFLWRGPERGEIVLVQRRVFILPTRRSIC